jgi:hypothetical protein
MPRPVAPPPAVAPSAPAARRDPFGFGVSAPAKAPPPAAPPPPEEDFGDIDVEASVPASAVASAPAPKLELSFDMEEAGAPLAARAPIELPEEPEAEPELAPMHAFIPPAAAVGHRPAAPAPAAAPRDGGEALLREALSKASLEVIEKVVWEVVPQLAETIIRENLEKLVKQRP